MLVWKLHWNGELVKSSTEVVEGVKYWTAMWSDWQSLIERRYTRDQFQEIRIKLQSAKATIASSASKVAKMDQDIDAANTDEARKDWRLIENAVRGCYQKNHNVTIVLLVQAIDSNRPPGDTQPLEGASKVAAAPTPAPAPTPTPPQLKKYGNNSTARFLAGITARQEDSERSGSSITALGHRWQCNDKGCENYKN